MLFYNKIVQNPNPNPSEIRENRFVLQLSCLSEKKILVKCHSLPDYYAKIKQITQETF